MKTTVWIVCGVLFVLTGCTAPRISWERVERGDFVEFGTSDERALVISAVHRMHPPVQATVTTIRITPDCPCYKKDKYGRVSEAGHCRWWTRFICIYPDCVDRWTVWHEMAHAFFYALPSYKRADWGAISPGVYGNRSGVFPRAGVLTAYGAMDYYENFADWLAWSLEYLESGYRAWGVRLELVDRSDPRYLAHLQFLRDCGALSPEDYAALEPLFIPTPANSNEPP